MPLDQIIEDYIKRHPDFQIAKLDYHQESIWLKRRSPSKATGWHKLLSVLTALIPIPVFRPTVIHDAQDTLVNQAQRLQLFAARQLAVPEVLIITPNYMVTRDVGDDLKSCLDKEEREEVRTYLLDQAMEAIIAMHAVKLCHGRPFLRDMTYHEGKVFFLDLEENPLSVMSLAEAQARDVWLFLNSVATYCAKDSFILSHLFERYKQSASPETLKALKKMVFLLKPLRFFAEHLLALVRSRDLNRAVKANKALEHCLMGFIPIRPNAN